jgi:hypothetical protein
VGLDSLLLEAFLISSRLSPHPSGRGWPPLRHRPLLRSLRPLRLPRWGRLCPVRTGRGCRRVWVGRPRWVVVGAAVLGDGVPGDPAGRHRIAGRWLDGLPQARLAGFGGSVGGMPPIVGAVNAPRNGAAGPRPESRLKVIPQLGTAPGVDQGTPGRWVNAPRGNSQLSEREELNGLRQAIAELAKERDVLIRSASRLIKEATS